MKHLIICREFPPAPSGGIGTYVFHLSHLLANSGETVHVIGQLWEGTGQIVEEKCNGRLIVHRLPLEDWTYLNERRPSPLIRDETARALFYTDYYPQSYSWQASLLTEKLVDQEGIDLIEAQEYEAPLYFLQVRRALNLGPSRNPPCIVHLHSPTELLELYNEKDMGSPRIVMAKRLEAYSIAAADALLCPSRYLSRQAEAHFGMIQGSIEVIPLPLGENPLVDRAEETWEGGTICYLGRLERRKGIIEWIDAAVSVALDYPSIRFEFIGANVLGTEEMSGEEFIELRIPREVRNRFHFHGNQERSALPKFLAKARMAVVPSRWENFPNTCVEAMCSGLPVIASPEGGMTEMVRDGQTGWIAPEASSTGLALALRRALATPPARLAEMGHQAANDIRKLCDNDTILERHLDFRKRVVQRGSKRSLHLPPNLPRLGRPIGEKQSPLETPVNPKGGLAIVVNCQDGEELLDECLTCLHHQTRPPASVMVILNNMGAETTRGTLERARMSGWQICELKGASPATVKNEGIKRILAAGVNPAGFIFLSPYDRIKPNYLETCESILRHCPGVGLVSSWTHHIGFNHRIFANPCPAFPYQILSDETSPTTTMRTEAIQKAGFFRNAVSPGYEQWDLANAVMAAGWTAVTIPAVLAEQIVTEQIYSPTSGFPIYSRQQQVFLSRVSEVVAQNACELVLLLESRSFQLHQRLQFFEKNCSPADKQILRSRDILRMSLSMQLDLVRKAARQPRLTFNFLKGHTKRAIGQRIKRIWAPIRRTEE